MNKYKTIFAVMLLLGSLLATNGWAQDTTGDFCQRHADLWDSDGNITLEGHKKLNIENRGWWNNSNPQGWDEWPTQDTRWTLEEHKNLYLNGQEWWFNSKKKDWEDWPQDQDETLDCHKKLYLSGPQWWFDSAANEWKPWPKSQ